MIRNRMQFSYSTMQTCWLLVLVTAFTLLQLPLPTLGYIQTSRDYQLDFNYDPQSAVGPPMWSAIEPSSVGEWSDFTVFMNTDSHDLKINNNYCEDSRRPSPVNLYPTTECDDDHEILTRKIGELDCSFSDLTFEIAPNMLRAFMPYVNTTCRLPTMNLSGDLPNDWTFIWLEVHLRSEHVIDGRRFDGEIQLIHLGNNAQKRELATPTILLDASSPFDEPRIQRFLDKWQDLHDAARESCSGSKAEQGSVYQNNNTNTTATADGVDSLLSGSQEQGSAFQINNTNATSSSFFSLLDKYAAHIENVASSVGSFFGGNDYSGDTNVVPSSSTPTHEDQTRRLQNNNTATNTTLGLYDQSNYGPRRKMFPYDLFPSIYYYKYLGSITYPPCSQIVRYEIFDEPLVISRRQLRQLGALQGSHINEQICTSESVVSPLGENVRPLQILNPSVQNSSHCQLDRYRLWKYPLAQQ